MNKTLLILVSILFICTQGIANNNKYS